MARNLGNMVIHLGLDSQQVVTGAKKAEGVVTGLASRLGSLNFGAILGGLSAAGAATWGIGLASQAETAQVAFEVMLGSAEAATKMLGDLRAFGAKTPFEFTGLQDASRTLLAFGIAGDQILPSLQMLGDVAGGNQEKLKSLSLVFGQVSSAGKLTGGDLLQFINAGFNPLQIIAEKTGISMVKLKKAMEGGLISFDMVKEAFKIATSEGGRFHGMMDKMSATLEGRWSTFKDDVSVLAMNISTKLTPALGNLLDMGSGLVGWLGKMDAATVENTIKIVAMTAAFTGAMMLVPKIIALIGTLIKAYRGLSAAQAIQQALSGPKGWATLAVSLTVAAGAGYSVNQMFSEQEEKVAAVVKQADKLATATDKTKSSFDSLKAATAEVDKSLEKFKSRAEQITEAVRTPMEVFNDTWSELITLQEKGLISAETYGRAMAEAAEELENAGKSAEKLSDIGNVQVGAAERFSMSGFSAVAEGRRQMQEQADRQRQQLEEQKRASELLTEIRDDNRANRGTTINRVSI